MEFFGARARWLHAYCAARVVRDAHFGALGFTCCALGVTFCALGLTSLCPWELRKNPCHVVQSVCVRNVWAMFPCEFKKGSSVLFPIE